MAGRNPEDRDFRVQDRKRWVQIAQSIAPPVPYDTRDIVAVMLCGTAGGAQPKAGQITAEVSGTIEVIGLEVGHYVPVEWYGHCRILARSAWDTAGAPVLAANFQLFREA